MSSFATFKLYPDKWFKNMSKDELKEARDQLRAYSMNKDLDTGLRDVSSFSFPTDLGLRSPSGYDNRLNL